MKHMKNKKFLILIIIISIVIATIGFSYAYTKLNVTIVSETQTIIRSKKLSLTFNDTKEINVSDMMPGKVVEKTFTVKSDADEELTYNIKWKDITNTYSEDVVYTLIRDKDVVVEETPMAKTNPEEYILTNIKIESGKKHEYILKIEYLNTDKAQVLSQNDIFSATVEIDVEEVEAEIIYVPYITSEITSTNATEENTITNEFTVRNSSATQTQTYNVLLEDIENEYEIGELTYSLEKNGEEISSGNIENEIMYLTTDEEIQIGKTDTYNLIIIENTENTVAYAKERYKFSLLSSEIASNSLSKKINAKIVIDKKEVDVTKPECNIIVTPEEWATSKTLTIIGNDANSGLASNPYSWDGTNYSTEQTKNITENGTYTAYVKDKVGNIQICNKTITKIETNITAPVLTSSSGTSNSITTVYNAGSAQSGIKTTTCYYGENSSPSTVGTLSGNNCVFSNLISNTTYYFKKCITSNAGNSTCSPVSSLLTAGAVYNYKYSGGVEIFPAPVKGTYKLEVWGAQGGTINSSYVGGYGGYSYGTYQAAAGKELYIYVGGEGGHYMWPIQAYSENYTSVTVPGGYNGGGNGQNIWSGTSTALQYNTSGGGATHIATVARGVLSNYASTYTSEVLLVAGGGGGAQYFYQDNGAYYSYCHGVGSGGGIYGNNAICTGTNASYVTYVAPASQTSGGTSIYNNAFGSYGSFGQGASGYSGGGGGLYGGTGNYQITGGGSGYIGNTSLTNKGMYCYNCTPSTATTTKTTSTTCANANPISNCTKQGNGYARITILSTSS